MNRVGVYQNEEMRVRSTDPKTLERSKELRAHMSLPERMLWSRLRGKQLGFVVRRQYAHGPYIMDFYVHELKLCIEIDGAGHELREREDATRNRYMEDYGITTIRIPAQSVLANVDDIAENLYHSFCERTGKDPLHIRGS